MLNLASEAQLFWNVITSNTGVKEVNGGWGIVWWSAKNETKRGRIPPTKGPKVGFTATKTC